MLRKITMIGLGVFFLVMLVPFAAMASTLSWDASEGTVSGYRIYYGTSQGGDYPDFAFSTGALAAAFTFYFQIRFFESFIDGDARFDFNPLISREDV